MLALLRAIVISVVTLSFNCWLFFNKFPSKQSGPKPLLKLLLFIASITSSLVNGGTLALILESICMVSSSPTLKSTSAGADLLNSGLLYMLVKYFAISPSAAVLSSNTYMLPCSSSLCTLVTTGLALFIFIKELAFI
jgi:hypothetical protein